MDKGEGKVQRVGCTLSRESRRESDRKVERSGRG